MQIEAPPSDGPMSLLFDIWLLDGLTTGLLDGVLAGTGLSGDDYGMYSLLRRYGPATPSQLHRWTGFPLTTVSAHLKRLEKRGHVTRTANPADGRSHKVGLTKTGERAHARATEPFLAAMHPLRERFVPDARQERLVLQRIDSVLREALPLDPRPYAVGTQPEGTTHDQAGTPALAYSGAPLTSLQEHQVRQYIDFLRNEESTPDR